VKQICKLRKAPPIFDCHKYRNRRSLIRHPNTAHTHTPHPTLKSYFSYRTLRRWTLFMGEVIEVPAGEVGWGRVLFGGARVFLPVLLIHSPLVLSSASTSSSASSYRPNRRRRSTAAVSAAALTASTRRARASVPASESASSVSSSHASRSPYADSPLFVRLSASDAVHVGCFGGVSFGVGDPKACSRTYANTHETKMHTHTHMLAPIHPYTDAYTGAYTHTHTHTH
jgi:hypothetical protein